MNIQLNQDPKSIASEIIKRAIASDDNKKAADERRAEKAREKYRKEQTDGFTEL